MVEIFEKLGTAGDIGNRRVVLRLIEGEIKSRSTDPYRGEYGYYGRLSFLVPQPERCPVFRVFPPVGGFQ